MKSRVKCPLFACLLTALASFGARAEEPVSVESLLHEMVDRDAVARFPQRDFRLKQHSSYNRSSRTPDEPAGWFTNKDFNSGPKDHNFIRVEENGGRKEWVMMDHEGPGAIVRTWMPWENPGAGGSKGTMRFYLDGSDEPVLVGNKLGLFDGSGLIPFPFAHSSLRSAVNFFPIPYAKRCKVTLDQIPHFYIFTFREYDRETPVRTFTMEDFEAAKGLTETTGRKLLNPVARAGAEPLALSTTLGAGEEKSLELPAGTAAVRELSVKLGNYENPEVTRQVILRIEFDGKETVWCPVGDFFGSGVGLNPVQGWYRTVAEDGTMTCRWVMPYQKGGKVTLLNLGDEAVEAKLEVKTGEWKWDENSMYFHAGWRGQYPLPTRPYSDWNYVTLKGRGVYVGDTLTIMNPVEKWWGEGDEKIWVDGEGFPSMFGTGTEDYYAYSWGGMSTDFYEHPFHAQPRAHKWNKVNRKPESMKGTRNTLGYSVETRSRALDTMPFASSLQLDMEIWHWADCEMGYGVGAYWYGFPDTTSNRKPEPEEVLNVPVLAEPVEGAADSVEEMFKGAVEITEELVVSKPDGVTLKVQDLKRMKLKGRWSKDKHLLFKGAKMGDTVEIKIPAASPVTEKLTLHATKSRDFGVVRISVNGKPAGGEIDLYATKPVPSGAIELGAFDPVDGGYVLRVEVVGRNAMSKDTFFGLDCVTRKEVRN
ncbi:MAG: glycoside hydrolase family 172 protein [Verrucomicrobiota bacterium JB025]